MDVESHTLQPCFQGGTPVLRCPSLHPSNHKSIESEPLPDTGNSLVSEQNSRRIDAKLFPRPVRAGGSKNQTRILRTRRSALLLGRLPLHPGIIELLLVFNLASSVRMRLQSQPTKVFQNHTIWRITAATDAHIINLRKRANHID